MNQMLNLMMFVMFCFGTALAQETRQLTLDDLKKYALSHNFKVKASAAAVDEVRAQGRQLQARFFPKLSAVGGLESLNQGTQRRSDSLGYLEGNWNLFKGSEDRVELEINNLNEKIAESHHKQSEFELELEVESLYYFYLYNQTRLKFLDESLELNEKHKALVRQKKRSGLASQADVMEFDIRDTLLRSERSGVLQEREEAKLGLTRLMGPNIGTNFEPFGQLPDLHLKQSLNEFLQKINSTSESVRSASLQSAAGALAPKAALSKWFPSVDVEAKYGKLSKEIAEKSPAVETLVVMRWEFFSGFETTGKVAEAKAKASRLENEFKQKLLTTMTEAEVSYGRLKSIQERVHVEEGNESKAKIYYNAVIDEYRRGIKNGADLKAAEELYLQAKSRSVELKFQFIAHQIQLEKAIGLEIETTVH